MKAGVNLINFGPSASPATLGQWADVVEGLGFHLLMTSDHIAITPDVAERYPAPFYEPLTTLAWLAARTRRMEIGSTVLILPYRHPLETARAFANIDRLSGGRSVFGVGIGWAEQEFETLGLPFRERGAMTDEYLEVVRRAWSEERLSFEGRYVRFRDVDTRPLPARAPRPPIWVGGNSDAAIRRTVRLGDAWHPLRIRLPSFESGDLPRLERIAREEGRPVPPVCPRIRLRLTPEPLPEEERLAGEGSLEQVRSDLLGLERLGCPYVLLDTYRYEVEETRRPEQAWRMLATVADLLLDLPGERVRG